MQREPGSVPELRTQRWEYEERKVAVILGQSCREKRGRDRECVCVCVCVCVCLCVFVKEREGEIQRSAGRSFPRLWLSTDLHA